MSRRVVITGGSCISSLGMEVEDVFSALKSLKNRVVRMNEWDMYAQMNTRLASPILALFFWEGGRNNLVTVLAVMLSAMTTLISFGSLVCSAFVPVSTFGFAVLLGIACCFLLSPLSAKH